MGRGINGTVGQPLLAINHEHAIAIRELRTSPANAAVLTLGLNPSSDPLQRGAWVRQLTDNISPPLTCGAQSVPSGRIACGRVAHLLNDFNHAQALRKLQEPQNGAGADASAAGKRRGAHLDSAIPSSSLSKHLGNVTNHSGPGTGDRWRIPQSLSPVHRRRHRPRVRFTGRRGAAFFLGLTRVRFTGVAPGTKP